MNKKRGKFVLINFEIMLFNETIFGPIHSRRLGASLGVNYCPLMLKFAHLIAFIASVDLILRTKAHKFQLK